VAQDPQDLVKGQVAPLGEGHPQLEDLPAHPAELPAAKRAGQVAAATATALEQPGTMQSSPQPAPNQTAFKVEI
jgi:hypothetical protein